MMDTSKHFQVDITIFKVTDLRLSNVSVAIDVIVGDRRKTVKAKLKGGDHAIFHRHLKFLFYQPSQEFFKTHLELRIRRKFAFPFRKSILGVVRMELATVWENPQHRFLHKRFPLIKPGDNSGVVNGNIECNIEIVTEYEDNVSEKDMLDTDYMKRKKEYTLKLTVQKMGLFKFNIYRGDGFNEETNCGRDMYVRVNFAGSSLDTNVSVNTTKPFWNEALCFLERMPTLHQIIEVEIWDKKMKYHVGSTCIYLKDLAYDGQSFTLPSVGPSFLYLYKKPLKPHQSPKFAGRILMSLNVENIAAKPFEPVMSINACSESMFPKYQQFSLVVTIYQVIFFQSFFNGQEIEVKLRHGSPACGPPLASYTHNDVSINLDNAGSKLGKSIFFADNYSYLNFSRKLFVLQVTTQWPAMERREERFNFIKNNINKISKRLATNNYTYLSARAKQKFSKEFIKLVTSLIDDLSRLKLDGYVTPLDVNKKKVFDEQLKKLKVKIKEELTRKKLSITELNRTATILRGIAENYTNDVVPSFPDIELILSREGHPKNFHRAIKVADYLNSTSKLHRGALCGRKQTIMFQDPSGNMAASMEASIWFGKYEDICGIKWKETTPGSISGMDPNEAKAIVPSQQKIFQLRAYIYQGRLKSGSHTTGLADPFVRILLAGESRETEVRAATLHPYWDETLVISKVVLAGDDLMIKHDSLGVVFEILDYDEKEITKLIGRGILRPRVVLAKDKYPTLKLKWELVYNYGEETGAVLMAMELLEHSHANEDLDGPRSSQEQAFKIPDEIRPHREQFELEVIFWGVRNFNPHRVGPSTKAVAFLECDGTVIYSEVIKPEELFNFPYKIKFARVFLPREVEYTPPICLSLLTINAFNHKTYVGSYILNNARSIQEGDALTNEIDSEKRAFIKSCMMAIQNLCSLKKIRHMIEKLLHIIFRKKNKENPEKFIDPDETNWWTKYYAAKKTGGQIGGIKIYNDELEHQPEFHGFQDFLQIAPLLKGQNSVKGIDDKIGILKYAIRLNPLKEENERRRSLNAYPPNAPYDVTVRAYIIGAQNLTPSKENRICNPYVIVSLGRKKISQRKNYVRRELNPIFGSLFEFKGTFPRDFALIVRLLDHNPYGDVLIGLTEIDIENRFYTKYRANCGLASSYEKDGLNHWRDCMEPCEILKQLCKITQINLPEFHESYARIGRSVILRKRNESDDELSFRVLKDLENFPEFGFQLVPEHVETRSLFHPRKPHLHQGKVEMWVDIFPGHERVPPPVDITPSKPILMELRVIVWGTASVPLDKGYLSAFSDLFVRGWLTSDEEYQQTDMHSGSISGEAIFNWRFIFPFTYSPAIQKILITRKGALFEENWVEEIPCELNIQVWDNELIFKSNLGSLTLNLESVPVGAKSARTCSLRSFNNPAYTINLFKAKKARGWWPFRAIAEKEEEYKMAGKVDLELQLLTKVEAEHAPAGLGREPPDPLPKPPRLNFAAHWLLTPLTIFFKMLCRNYGSWCLMLILLIAIVYFFLVGIYAIPGYAMKKIMNA